MSFQWRLPTEIIALSRAKTWQVVVKEWQLDYIERLEPGEDPGSCLCGHTPIIELCHIRNTITDNTAIVGNHCIRKFEKEDSAHEVFKDIPKIFRSVNKLLKDESATASKALLDYACQKEVLTKRQVNRYKRDKGKRYLRASERHYRIKCNNLIIFAIAIKDAKAAYQRLFQDHSFKTTAGPKLIDYAFEKGVLTKKNYDFYKKIWDRAHGSLTYRQKKYKVDLNKRIIFHLQTDFGDDLVGSSIRSKMSLDPYAASSQLKKNRNLFSQKNVIRGIKRKRRVIESDDES